MERLRGIRFISELNSQSYIPSLQSYRHGHAIASIITKTHKPNPKNLQEFSLISHSERLRNCRDISDLRKVHALILTTGFSWNAILCCKILSSYANFNSMKDARQVFDKMPAKDIISWSSMVSGYSKNKHPNEAIHMFQQMRNDGIMPNSYTVVAVLQAIADLRDINSGKLVHSYIITSACDFNVYVGTTLINMYGSSGNVADARNVLNMMPLKNAFAFNAMLGAYAENACAREALTLFQQMQFQGMHIDSVTMGTMFLGLSGLKSAQIANILHGYCLKHGFVNAVVGAKLIDIYSKSGAVEDAEEMFWSLPDKDVVIWTAMISGYEQNGWSEKAIWHFKTMIKQGFVADSVSVTSVISACSHLGGLLQAYELHSYLIRLGFDDDVMVNTALLDMYSKCGSIEIARRVFGRLGYRDVVAYNAVIAGYSIHGRVYDVIGFVNDMVKAKVSPNESTALCFMSACSRAGMEHEAWQMLGYIISRHGVRLGDEHFGTIVDMLGRAGNVDKAYDLISKRF